MADSATPGSIFAGLMSGTSMDGIDAALVEFGDHQCKVLATLATPYPEALQSALLQAATQPETCSLDLTGELDQWVGECFSAAATGLLETANIEASAVTAIGSHGQTIRHQPHGPRPFSLQIGDPNMIAAGTGITTVADFRRGDVVLGGEGAPLAPAFHRWLFTKPGRNRVILNMGGFGNVTLLHGDAKPVTGFDTGPANTLLDSIAREHLGQDFDENGAFAARGTVSNELLQCLLDDEYFSLPPPKSTGFEYFNRDWLMASMASGKFEGLRPEDLQATLAEFSACSMSDAIHTHMPGVEEVFVCGGGVHNVDLMRRLAARLAPAIVDSTAVCGLDPDWVEAAAFAWLAKRRLDGKPGNLPRVTGARGPAILGAVYLCAT